jgi:hypothetical protein
MFDSATAEAAAAAAAGPGPPPPLPDRAAAAAAASDCNKQLERGRSRRGRRRSRGNRPGSPTAGGTEFKLVAAAAAAGDSARVQVRLGVQCDSEARVAHTYR